MRGSRSNLSDSVYTTKIRLLDDSEISYEFKKDVKGQALVDFVSDQLDLFEKDYFGLRYVDNNKQRHWLDLTKEVAKQLKDCRHPYMFFFRIKFYPTDPTKLAEEISRYQVYLQLKRDILHGRLLCPFNNITDLAAHIVQAEIGDYNVEEHGDFYLVGLKLLPRQNNKLEEKIFEYHKTLQGYNPAEAENRFLNLARSQDLYGVDPHPCKDSEDFPLYLGLTPQGIQIIREARRVSGFAWPDVNKVSYDNKMFYIQILRDKEKANYAFRLNDTPSCKHLWRCAVEHMSFYSDEPLKSQGSRKSVLTPQSLFRRSKNRFSGKTENQIVMERDSIKRNAPKRLTRKSTLKLSTQVTAKNRLSMPNLQMAQPYMANSEDANHNGSNDSESQSSTKSTPQTERHPKHSLAEFEVKDFPDVSESSRNSMDVDGVSTCSSVENLNTSVNDGPVVCEGPIFKIEQLDEEEVIVPNVIPKVVINEFKENDINNSQIKTNNVSNQNNYHEMLRNPVFILMLIAIILIPVSVLVTIVVTKK